MNYHQPLAFLFVGDRGDCEDLTVGFEQFVQLFFYFDVGNHFSADFAEAAEAVGDAQESVFVLGGDVAGVVPAVFQNFGGFLRKVQITDHHVRPAHEQQPRLVHGESFAGIRINDADTDSRERMADSAALGSHLAEIGGTKVVGVDGDYR